ncbi:hypothetical protein [Microbacterium aurugineum]|uniref:Uncharacterized protein n=1 Tax=Microbacterium aurugineum TaxID=2851642 RepID=A0ABY4IXC9_9MICO|nr:hypothetical protein [Microbacterium aurugineum]UPL17332.1 hypothetical protein KV397_05975 [Microbacterium aurugineum]
MPLLGPKPLRALAFVEALTSEGVYPSREDVHAFVEARTSMWDFDPMRESMMVSIVDYLLEARLLRRRNGALELTPAGTALLRNADPEGGGAVEVVGRVSDPFTYAAVLTQIDSIPNSLVIDPYLQSRDLMVLLQLRHVERVLIRPARAHGVTQEARQHQLRIAVGARPDVQLRAASGTPSELHDRVVLSRDGSQALFLGTSLGGTQMTVLTRVQGPTAAVLRDHYEALWQSAEDMAPIAREQSMGE